MRCCDCPYWKELEELRRYKGREEEQLRELVGGVVWKQEVEGKVVPGCVVNWWGEK